METVYDWVTVGIFAGIIVLFLQRSSLAEPDDSMWQYLGVGLGCAAANYFGNEGRHLIAVPILLLTLGYIALVLRPFRK